MDTSFLLWGQGGWNVKLIIRVHLVPGLMHGRVLMLWNVNSTRHNFRYRSIVPNMTFHFTSHRRPPISSFRLTVHRDHSGAGGKRPKYKITAAVPMASTDSTPAFLQDAAFKMNLHSPIYFKDMFQFLRSKWCFSWTTISVVFFNTKLDAKLHKMFLVMFLNRWSDNGRFYPFSPSFIQNQERNITWP